MSVLLLSDAPPIPEQGAGTDEWDLLQKEALGLHRSGDYDRALVVAGRALEVAEKKHGRDHPNVATSLNSLAESYRAQYKFAKAEPLYKRSLAIREKALGPDHPEVATSLHNLAELYWSQYQNAKAEPFYARALAIREKALGPRRCQPE